MDTIILFLPKFNNIHPDDFQKRCERVSNEGRWNSNLTN